MVVYVGGPIDDETVDSTRQRRELGVGHHAGLVDHQHVSPVEPGAALVQLVVQPVDGGGVAMLLTRVIAMGLRATNLAAVSTGSREFIDGPRAATAADEGRQCPSCSDHASVGEAHKDVTPPRVLLRRTTIVLWERTDNLEMWPPLISIPRPRAS